MLSADETRNTPVRLLRTGQLLIGDDEFPYAIVAGSIKVEPFGRGFNKLTMTILVGEVAIEPRPGLPLADQ